MKLATIAAAFLGILGLAPSANASPITYHFSGTLATSVNGSTSVSGTFTLDKAIPAITDWSFTEPLGVFDTTNSTADIAQFTEITSNADFVAFTFVYPSPTFEVLSIQFETTLAAFDGSAFHTDPVTFSGGTTVSELLCDPLGSDSACSAFGASRFASGAASPEPTPEPASLFLFGSGFTAAIMRLRRRKA